MNQQDPCSNGIIVPSSFGGVNTNSSLGAIAKNDITNNRSMASYTDRESVNKPTNFYNFDKAIPKTSKMDLVNLKTKSIENDKSR